MKIKWNLDIDKTIGAGLVIVEVVGCSRRGESGRKWREKGLQSLAGNMCTGTVINITFKPNNDGFKPSSDDGKKVDQDLRNENECKDQEKEDKVNNTNNVISVSSTIIAAGRNEDNELSFDPTMPALEDVSIFNFSSDNEDDGTKWVFSNRKDERGIAIRNKGSLVAQGNTPEEEIDYDEVFAPS
uniref:Copia protein n=1 Tax=Tanacetum cinerariifolium TaxID=118510 RepID=A0A6L2L8U2_TANCI|nr:copia protein [Tanacetum cinerariifolium]